MPKVGAISDLAEVWVVSRGRWEHSDTLEETQALPYGKVFLAVHSEEREQYKPLAHKHNCELVDMEYSTISEKRQLIAEQAGPKFIMLDDDLRFYRRKVEGQFNLRYIKPEEMLVLIRRITNHLDTFAHVGVSAREGNNRLETPAVFNTRYMRVLAYRREEYLACEHGRINYMEDFDVALQLLRRGHQSLVISDWAQGQKGTQAPGGCALHRTNERHEEAVRNLEELHRGYVKLRQKNNKTGGEFGSRLEATIYWQKAYQSSQQKPIGKPGSDVGACKSSKTVRFS